MSHPDVQKAIDTVYDATKAAGKAAGVHMGAGKTIKERMENGYEFITIGNDLSLLRRGVRELRAELGLK
jgi:4-hydroxy-2-oxoheptanedioate aldolase